MNKGLSLLFGLLLALPAAGVDYYVATNGSAVGTGAIGDPVTWNRLNSLIYALNQPATAKNVYVRGGNYYNVGERFNGWRYNNMTVQPYPGETVKLYGGSLLTNWTDLGTGVWSAPLPAFPQSVTNQASAYSDWRPSMLLADDQVVTWTRMPLTGKYHYTSYSGDKIVVTNDIPAGTNLYVRLDYSWNDGLYVVSSNNTSAKALTFTTTPSRGASSDNVRTMTFFNDPAGLVENSWYWDKTNLVVYYMPPAGQTPTNKTMVISASTRILAFDGAYDNKDSNCLVTNITFACTTSYRPVQADNGGGANQHAALTFGYGTNCAAYNCTFFGIGGHAIGPGPTAGGTNYNIIVANNTILDAGSDGIILQGQGHTITNNRVYNCGTLLQSGIGIYASQDSLIAYNTITNINGAGIAGSQTASGFTILSNTIVRAVKELRDMGAIYFKGTNSVIMGNYVAEVYGTNDNYSAEVWDGFVHGIYSDDSSWGHTIASNILVNCARPLHHNSWNPVTIKNNFFINWRSGEPSWLQGIESTNNRVFENNIWYADGELKTRFVRSNVTYPVDSGVSNWTGNLVYSGAGITYPTNATAGDPLFYNTTPVLRDTSPALALGIQPLRGTYSAGAPASIASYTNLTIYGGRVSGVVTH